MFSRSPVRSCLGIAICSALALIPGYAQEPEREPAEPTATPQAGDATLERARGEVVRFQERRSEELLTRHTEAARTRLQSPERFAERTFRDREPCVEAALLSERFDCYLEPQAEGLDPFCVYNRRVQCEGLPDTTLFYVSLEPGSGAIQRIQRIDTEPPSPWVEFLGKGCLGVIAAGVMGGFVLALVFGIWWGIRYYRRLQREYLDRAAKALGADPPEVFRRDTRIEGQVGGRRASAGIDVRSYTYYYDDRPRTRFTFHPWIQLDYERPLSLELRVTGRPPEGWISRLYYRIFPAPAETELGDPRFDERFQLETSDLAAARELLATPIQGASIARWLIAHADREIVLDQRGVRLACSLSDADDAWLAETLDLGHQLVDWVESARRD